MRLKCAFCAADGVELRAGLDVYGQRNVPGGAIALAPAAAVVVCKADVAKGAEWLAEALLEDWPKDATDGAS